VPAQSGGMSLLATQQVVRRVIPVWLMPNMQLAEQTNSSCLSSNQDHNNNGVVYKTIPSDMQ